MVTRTVVVGAALSVGALLMGPTSVIAADLKGDAYGEVYREGAPYEDPRYGDMYRHPAPQRHAAPRHDYERYPAPPPHVDHYREGRFAGPPSRCLPREAIRDQLEHRGWSDFQDVDLRGSVANLRARRNSGRWFDLSVDRCTGQVLDARVVDNRAAGYEPRRYRDVPPGYAPGYPAPPRY